jgi:putative peptide zinc metalloprotease protein
MSTGSVMSTYPTEISMAAASPEAVRSRLCRELTVEPVEGGGDKRRFALYHPRRDTTCVLGEAELTIARLFDGRRSLEEIAARALSEHRLRLSVEQLRRFEERLRRLYLLEGEGDEGSTEDPFTSVHYGKLRAAVCIRLFSANPDEALDRLLRRFPFLATRGFFGACLAVVVVAAAELGLRFGAFSAAASAELHGLGWVALFCLIGLQSVFHEGGHALGCKSYGVRVHEVGLALYFFLLTGWARPIQAEWDRLSKSRRIVTILVGPFGSLLFGALGVLLWRLSPDGSLASRAGLLAALSTPAGIVPTMLPIFNGDGYLLLTECLDQPGLRQRSWAYLRARLSGDAGRQVPPGERRLYLFVSIATLIGLVAAWVTLFGLILYVAARELSS